jgi:hypothetical protein
VHSADARDLRLALNDGWRERFAKNAAQALCRCRNDCCNGTDDTSLGKPRSSVFFHTVNAAEDCT